MSIETQQLHRHLIAKDRSLPCTRYLNMNQILPFLYLGDCRAILNPVTLISKSITHVLSIRQSRAYIHEQHLPIQHAQIFLDDSEETYLLDSVNAAMEFLEDAIEAGGTVLVHCQEGRSRSASIVIAYRMICLVFLLPLFAAPGVVLEELTKGWTQS